MNRLHGVPRLAIRLAPVLAGALVLLLYACFVFPSQTPAAASTTTPGTLAADFAVDMRGAATYHIPIPLPPGTRELGPKLALAYSSASNNGMAGMGFDLSGLQAIDRTGANIRQDGFKGGIRYDENDRFQLNGERLLAVAASGDTVEYRTEKESWSKVTAHFVDATGGRCGSGPCWFSLVTKDGARSTFGRYDDSRIEALDGDGSVRAWALDEVLDLNQNGMRVRYTSDPLGLGQDEGQFYPASIEYSFHRGEGGDEPARREVTFHYEARPDVLAVFIGGSAVTTRARLSAITAQVAGQPAPSVHLSYETAPATGRSRLVSIQACAGDGSVCKTPTEFAWQNQGQTFDNDGAWLGGEFVLGWDIASDPRYLSDVNGDGRLDIVGFRLDTRVSLAEESLDFAPSSSWNDGFGAAWTVQTPREVADVNGDGLGDVIGFNFGGVEVAPSNGSRFDPSQWTSQPYPYFGRDGSAGGWVAERHPRMMADVDGDGLADIVGFHEHTEVALSRQTYFEPPAVWNESDFTGDAWWLGSQRLRHLADVTGDGLVDVIGFGNDRVLVGVSRGRSGGGFDVSMWSQNASGYPYFGFADGWLTGRHPRVMADVNGDGLADIVGFKDGVQVGLSTGDGFLPPQTWSPGFSIESTPIWRESDPRLVMDVNGDGLADIVGFNIEGAKVGIASGSAFVATEWNQDSLPTFQGGRANRLLTAGDVNGDGMTDVVSFGAELLTDNEITVGLSVGNFPDLLTEITDGLGGRFEITYAPLTDSEVYGRSSVGTTQAIGRFAEPEVADEPNGQAFFTSPVPYQFSAISSNFPIQQVVGRHVHVVAEIRETTDPARQAASYDYRDRFYYTEARLDLLSQRWLGFKTLQQTQDSLGRELVQVFNQGYPLDGSLAHSEVRCAASSPDPRCTPGALMRIEELDWQSRVTATGSGEASPPVYEVLEMERRRDEFTYGQYDLSIGRELDYDPYGNPSFDAYLGYVSRTGEDLDSGDNVYTCTSFANVDPDGDWKLGYPLFVKQSSRADCSDYASFDPAFDLGLEAHTYDVASGTMNELSEGLWDDQSGTYLNYSYTYDPYGNAITMTTPQGFTGTTEWDEELHTFPVRLSSPPLPEDGGNRLVTEESHDPRFGIQTSEVRPNGNVRINCLDAFGRMVALQVSTPEGAASDVNCLSAGAGAGRPVTTTEETHYESDGSGGIYERTAALQDWPQQNGSRDLLTDWSYVDGRGRLIKTVEESGPEPRLIAGCTVFDQDDEEVANAVPFFGALGAGCEAGGSTALWLTAAYDVLSREVRATRPNGPEGQATVVDTTRYVDSQTIEQTWDSTGPVPYRMVKSTRYFEDEAEIVSSRVPGDDNATSTFTYDRLGRLLSATDPPTRDNPEGVTMRFEYDSIDRPLLIDGPDRGPSRVDYLGTEWVQRYTDGYGVQEFEHDPIGRVLVRRLPDSSRFEFSYDDATVPYGRGQQTGWRVVSAAGSEESSAAIGYDTQDLPSVETLTTSEPTAGTFTTRREHDPQTRERRIVFADGAVAERHYSGGNLDRLNFEGQVLAELGDYTALRQPGRYVYPQSGVVEQIAYYPTGQFWTQQVSSGGAIHLDTATSWNGLNLVSAIVDRGLAGGTDRSESFTYDSLRLTEVAGPLGTRSYGYDSSGNLIRRDDVDYVYRYHRPETGRRDGSPVYAAQYDAVGSVVRREAGGEVWSYDYDPLARLRSVQREGDPETHLLMTYAPEGERLTKVEADGTATLYIASDYQQTRAASGVLRTHYLNLDGGESVVAFTTREPEASADPEGLPALGALTLHRNHLGSTRLTTDDEGRVVNEYVYAAYGALTVEGGPDDVRPKFTGKELDESSDLYYFSARYLDPSTGRFLTADDQPAGDVERQDSFNPYAYALDAPSSLVDPTGHAPHVPAVAVAAKKAVAKVASMLSARSASAAASAAAGTAARTSAVAPMTT
ncbi:MAG: RHS repeat-associated core domain-containing protein, partial [Acidobacteriota bacterium]